MENRNRTAASSYRSPQNRRPSGREEAVHVRKGPRRGYNAAQKRRRNRRIVYVCIFAAVVIAAVVIFCSSIMKVSEVQVAGSSRYSEADILSACPIQPQDNLLTADTEAAALAIEQKLPYVGEATVKRKFPSRIVVTVSEAEKLGTIEQSGKYIVLSKDYKVLEISETPVESEMSLKGITLISPEPGKVAEFKNEEAGKVLVSLQNSIASGNVEHVTEIDLTDLAQIKMVYDGRVTMNLGVPDHLEYKVAFGMDIILNKDGNGIESDAAGTLDLSRAADTDRAVFTPADLDADSSASSASAPDDSAASSEGGDDASGDGTASSTDPDPTEGGDQSTAE